MDQLSQALNLAPQPMQSACSRLHRRILKSIPRKIRLYLYGVDTLAEFSGATMGGSEACQGRKPTLWRRKRRCAGKPNSYRQPPAFSPFQPQNRVYCPKNIFYCPKRTKSDKKQTENKYSPGVASFRIHDNFASKQKTLCRRLSRCRRDRRSVSTRPTRPSLYPGLRNNLMRLPCAVLRTVLKWRDKGV